MIISSRRTSIVLLMIAVILQWHAPVLSAENMSSTVKKAVELSTLDQRGTKPFHLKAAFAPSRDRDANSHRNGDIEIWWESSTRWRREVRSPEFHQILIMDGDREWQQNEGDFFPEWLRELAQAVVKPVPVPLEALLERVKSGDVRHLPGQTNINWDPVNDTGDVQITGNGYIALADRTGLLLYTGGPGWSGEFADYRDFHGRKIAYKVSAGEIEVTANITVLEDLGTVPPQWFDAGAPGGDPHPIETVVLQESQIRSNLIPGSDHFEWPTVENGPFEGTVWTAVVVDREGKIREMIPPVADNPAMKEAAEKGFRSMQFSPVLRNGISVQALAKLSVTFKTSRPAGIESFDTARSYFERARKVGYMPAGADAPYVLRAEFQVSTASGIQTGRYEDTWINTTLWRREAWLGSSHSARSQAGDQHYRLAEGPDAGILALMMTIIEPIPASDTMTESDWRIRRETVQGIPAIRVVRGSEDPHGDLDPANSQGFWFDAQGGLLKSYTKGLEILPSKAESYDGVHVSRAIDVLKDGKLGMRISITNISPAPESSANPKLFRFKGHEWQRAFTAEVR